MKKIFLLVVLLFSVTSIWSQRNQIIAYMDMEYILENVPEYIQAQNTLDAKVAKWRKKLDDQARHIEVLKSDLANEKAILTKDLIEEKEEEISIKQVELRRLESLYFGPNGDLFLVRKQLVKPIQDQVYNAVQSIAKRKNYDFVFEKSSDLVMLYSNKKYDISELVLSTIDRTRLQEQKKEERNKKKAAPKKEVTKVQQEKIEQKEELQNKKIEAVAKKIADQEAKKKEIADKRKALMKQREEKRKLLRQKKEEARKKKEEEKKEKEKEKEKNKEDN
ncbi:OmpH family outer membrane protein [Polaribacter dokdonensis]|uniref:Periplasmic chaperone for outer membrane proteins Skp n=2 Tax=Polaribacter dokdonensis DSW-5 TaxID=1300348 RepID=A0A1H5F6R7_9FLAO|nr:OmpH family outer membrane protein [Polaribacter dokdonensis]SED99086.1 periplasmic chaperone for outer membrane proteins Skp [Polaribacter dokdonensis DSW-5]